MTVLHERRTAGFSVRLLYKGEGEPLTLEAWTELHSASVAVAPERAANAFHHPCTYLPTPERFFRAEPLTTSDDEEVDIPFDGGGSLALEERTDDFCSYCAAPLLSGETGVCNYCFDNR